MSDGELRHGGGGDGGDHLRAVLGDAAGFVFAADHEAGDVLQEEERNAALAGELDEVRALLRAFGEQDAVVGEDGDRHAPDAREAGDERFAIELLELVELGAVDDAGDDFAHIVGRRARRRDDAVELSAGS
jgi:hypothetical protein